jgi:hypothetical protein
MLMTGGGVRKSVVLDVKSETRSVADIIKRRSGWSQREFTIGQKDAEVQTLIFFLPSFHISSRSLTTRLKTPIKISVFMLLSCASSTTMTEYRLNKKSIASSRSNTPSVMNFIVVVGDTVASYRIWYDTRDVDKDSSDATREAIAMAATRRGCVTPIMPGLSMA